MQKEKRKDEGGARGGGHDLVQGLSFVGASLSISLEHAAMPRRLAGIITVKTPPPLCYAARWCRYWCAAPCRELRVKLNRGNKHGASSGGTSRWQVKSRNDSFRGNYTTNGRRRLVVPRPRISNSSSTHIELRKRKRFVPTRQQPLIIHIQ